MRPLLASLFVMGCGGPPFPDTGGCAGGINTEDLRDCYCLADEKAGAEAVLRQLGVDPPTGVTVWIRATDEKFEDSDGYAWGLTLDSNDVELSRWAGAWAHELLHVHELRAGVPRAVTAVHTGWEERGWLKTTLAFQSAQPHCGDGT